MKNIWKKAFVLILFLKPGIVEESPDIFKSHYFILKCICLHNMQPLFDLILSIIH